MDSLAAQVEHVCPACDGTGIVSEWQAENFEPEGVDAHEIQLTWELCNGHKTIGTEQLAEWLL